MIYFTLQSSDKKQQQYHLLQKVQQQTMSNKVNQDCFIHRRICNLFCTFSQCEIKIICTKCLTDHLKVHPRNFIYGVENIGEIHQFDKLGRLKQSLGKQKMSYEERIPAIYSPFEVMLAPLIWRVKQFEKQSKQHTTKELLKHLVLNKTIIENCKIIKSDPLKSKLQPEVMIDEIIAEVSLVNLRETQMKENTERFSLYLNSTEQMGKSVENQVKQMSDSMIKFFDNCFKVQSSLFTQKMPSQKMVHDDFFRKYSDKHRIASKIQNNNLQLTLVEFKRIIKQKQDEVKAAREQNMSLLARIDQLNKTIERLKEQIFQFKSKGQREERERKEAISVARQKMEEYLIRAQVVFNQSRSISLQKKTLQQKFLDVLLTMIKNPIQLILSQHNLNKDQLQRFLTEPENSKFSLKPIKTFRMSFLPIDTDFLIKAFNFFQNIQTLQLNSCSMNDQDLQKISAHYPLKLKHLHLIDNQLTDDGLEKMLMITQKRQIKFDSLFLSYNSFSDKAIDAINRSCWDIKTLHISKNQIKNKGVYSISRCLKNLEQLFIGGTGVTKQGIMSICKTCLKLKRLSLVATEITTDTVSEILLGLQKLEWLDISYSALSEADIKMVEKLKVYNKNCQIVIQS